jgi:hypothetical protein
VEDLTKRAQRARTARKKKKKISGSNKPSAKSLHSIPPVKSMTNLNATSDNTNTMRQGKAPESSIGGYSVISEELKGLRLGQARTRRHMRPESKPRKWQVRRKANVATGKMRQ